jgi:hypothetical protein
MGRPHDKSPASHCEGPVSIPVHVRFVVDEVALEKVFLEVLQLSPANYHSINASFFCLSFKAGKMGQLSA